MGEWVVVGVCARGGVGVWAGGAGWVRRCVCVCARVGGVGVAWGIHTVRPSGVRDWTSKCEMYDLSSGWWLGYNSSSVICGLRMGSRPRHGMAWW